jgi:hypothetical protein
MIPFESHNNKQSNTKNNKASHLLLFEEGVGMDDAFVLAAAWKLSDPNLPLVERLGSAYGEAAMSVTITTLTDIVSFAIGACFSNVRGIFTFCIFSGEM